METSRDILLWLKTISKKNNLKEKLGYKNISLWWFFEFALVDLVVNLIRNKAYKYHRNIFIEYAIKIPQYYYLYLSLKLLPRFILGKLMNGNPKKDSGRGKIMALSHSGYWKRVTVMQSGNKALDQDTILGDITTALRREGFNVIALDQGSSTPADIKTMIEKRGLWKPIETYLTFDAIRNAFRASRRYHKEWSDLKNSREFINSLNFNGVSLFNSLKGEFKKIFKYHAFEAVLFMEIARQAINMEKPDLILTTYEYGLLGRAAVIAGKLERVPTLAIQHGNISLDHAGYIHIKEEISHKIAPQYCPLPDKTAVYGPWVKKMLVESCNYPEDSVVVTGQARYDMLARADEIFSKERFCKRYGLDQDKKIALVCTQPLPIFEERMLFLRGILIALKAFPEVQIIIKPHPTEKSNWHEKIAKEQETKASILPEHFNTYEALYVCDVMIASFSTTVTEALILNKPAIVVNLTGELDSMPYVESGAAIGASREEDIAPAIRTALYDKEVHQRLAKARNEFVYEHTYLQDGQGSKRVADLIIQMIEESREAKSEASH